MCKYFDVLADSYIEIYKNTPDFAQEKSVHKESGSLFFAGCSLLNDAPELVEKTYELLHEKKIVDGMTSLCCGKILQLNPNISKEDYEYYCNNLLETFKSHKVKKIIIACPNCLIHLQALLNTSDLKDQIEIISLPKAFESSGVSISCQDDLAIFDPCIDRKWQVFCRPLRGILDAPNMYETDNTPNTSYCCGALQQARGDIENAMIAAQARGKEGKDTGAKVLLVSCMSCARILSFNQSSIEVRHYLEYLFNKKIDWSQASYHMNTCLFLDDHGDLCNVR